MLHRWSDEEEKALLEAFAPHWGELLALRVYSSRLLGRDPALVLHGGGNTSVKGTARNLFGDEVPALFVKASGVDLATAGPEGYPGLALDELLPLRRLEELDDDRMVGALRSRLFSHRAPTPSIEALVHAFLPFRFIDHTHADAVLALTNREDGERFVREALGDDVVVVPYRTPGFKLARAAVEALEAAPSARGMVWLRHGLVTWGDTARESYDATVELVTRAERYGAARAGARTAVPSPTPVEEARRRYAACAPVVRGLLSPSTGDPDRPRRPVVLQALIDRDVLDLLEARGANELLVTPPLTADHLIRTKSLPLWFEAPAPADSAAFRSRLAEAVEGYGRAYQEYVARHGSAEGPQAQDPLPRVVLVPGLGVVCAGKDAASAAVCRDITARTLATKALSSHLGRYEGLSESELFAMEYRGLQQAKLGSRDGGALAGRVALVTGAAGAIGSGVCDVLLREGCHVAVTDLPGAALDEAAARLAVLHPGRVLAVPLDVTRPASVEGALERVIHAWGGIDLGVINAGLAHVAPLVELDLEQFRRLESVNVEGTLLLLQALGRHFALQGLGGDLVLVSTKNVFAPGAQFGAYSATKAAAHQLARIASLEFAPLGVRVNMVAPDAVFSHGARKSGLWQEVGPGRMRARGLDEKGLEEYYRDRNLLKARVTAEHVGRAVLFFVTRQTPTTGATIPVDGGLPDATPR